MRKISLNADDLILKHDIKLDNRYDFKLIFWWNELFRIQRANSIKDIYILKKMNKTCLERTYANNRLKRFKIKCEIVYERVIDVVTSAHEMRSEDYYVGLHFLEALNRKIFWREFWEWKLCNAKVR